MYRLLLVLFSLLPLSLFAQSVSDDCDKVFTKVQHIPSLKILTEKFNDTLTSVLKDKGFPMRNNEITLKFVVTVNGKIDEVTIDAGNARYVNDLVSAVVSLAGVWNTATQNGYQVCAYVRLHLVFVDKKIAAETMP